MYPQQTEESENVQRISVEDISYQLPDQIRTMIFETLLWYEQQYRSMAHANDRIHRYAEHQQLEPDAGEKARVALEELNKFFLVSSELHDTLIWLQKLGKTLRGYDHVLYGMSHSEAEHAMENDGGVSILEVIKNYYY